MCGRRGRAGSHSPGESGCAGDKQHRQVHPSWFPAESANRHMGHVVRFLQVQLMIGGEKGYFSSAGSGEAVDVGAGSSMAASAARLGSPAFQPSASHTYSSVSEVRCGIHSNAVAIYLEMQMTSCGGSGSTGVGDELTCAYPLAIPDVVAPVEDVRVRRGRSVAVENLDVVPPRAAPPGEGDCS